MSEEFNIESGVPIPKKVGKPDKNRSLINKMEIGDSIFFPDSEYTDSIKVFYSSARLIGRKVSFRRVDGGVRMWRVE